jgi:hypothetical protein
MSSLRLFRPKHFQQLAQPPRLGDLATVLYTPRFFMNAPYH